MPGKCLNFRRLVLLPKLGILILTLSLPTAQVRTAHADGLKLAKTKLIWPSFGGAFPTGRFGETDVDASPPKTGQRNGIAPALDLGYFLTENFAFGIHADLERFKIDYGRLTAPKSAHTTVISAGAWARIFPPGGYQYWRPYLIIGIGLGRPKASIEYSPPLALQVADSTIFAAKAESRVRTSLSMTGGLGVLVPFPSALSLSIETRYRSLSTKGVNRTDKFVTPEGLTIESDTGEKNGVPFRLKSKSNTTWWELRVGLALMIE